MFPIVKRILIALAVAFYISGMSIAPALAAAADDAPIEIIPGGDFKIASLNTDHLITQYHLAKYDVINIMVVGFPDGIGVNDITIGPDGYVQLPYAGAVKLAGLTIPQATRLLTQKLGEYIKIPSMSIIIKSYGPRKVYVMGDVKDPGIKEMPIDSLNVFAALSAAGGVTNRGRIKHIQVLRSIDGTMYYKEVNMHDYVKKHDMKQNLALQDGDIVYVPDSNKIVFSEDILPYISMYGLYKNLTD
ncbi:polysaccharide biosynthesis/export family protein [Pectinatus sottacetonis]|uniref:polysaccharide biosynthesis/export family protein n=1 Tax=Pectinatus sottacetonis TaxID=1002795 RepID=UPI002ED9EAA2